MVQHLVEYIQLNTLETWRMLRVLGYDVDKDNHVTKEGVRCLDYYGDPVDVRHCAILPGKKHGDIVIINDDLLNMAMYFTVVEE